MSDVNRTRITHPDGEAVTATDGDVIPTLRTCYTYDARGRRTGETLPAANLSSCPASQTGAQPYTSNQRYDAMGRVTGTISALPNDYYSNPHLAVRNSYDAAGRLIKVETGTLSTWQSETVAPVNWGATFSAYRTQETLYDAMGRKTREWVREGPAGTVRNATQYSYDIMSRLDCTALRMNEAAFGALPASACTPGSQGGDGPDRITRNFYDAAGQRTQLREGLGTADEAAEATWSYDLNGQMQWLTDGNGNANYFYYDGHGRRIYWVLPSRTTPGTVDWSNYEYYEYDPNSNRILFARRNGYRIAYQYDALNRMTAKTYPYGGATPVYYGYDLQGLQLFARFDSASGEGITNAYDGFGELRTHGINISGVTRTLGYNYDPNGSRTDVIHPDYNFFSTHYDGVGRPFYLSGNGSTGIAYALHLPHGALSHLSRVNTAVGWSYDGVQRPATHNFWFAGGGGGIVTWAFDPNPANQLGAVWRDNDAYAWTGHYAVARPYTANGLNQYTAAGGTGFQYDGNGNLTLSGTTGYTYDVENRLIGSGNVTLRYDPLGRLHQLLVGGAVTTTFLYDGDALAAEYDGAGNMTRRYGHWPGADVPMVSYLGAGLGSPTQLFPDRQGSIVAHADWSGNVTQINRYDEYGIPAATNTGRFQYTGQIWLSELGLYHYKARVYSPTLGRFLQTDPVGYEGGINLYAYVGNDPINLMDPSGAISTGCGSFTRWNSSSCTSIEMTTWVSEDEEEGGSSAGEDNGNSEDDGPGHRYRRRAQICAATRDRDCHFERVNSEACVVPGHVSPQPIASGRIYPIYANPLDFSITGFIPAGFVRTTQTGPYSFRNTTTAAHPFVGTVDRSFSQDRHGSVYVDTIGEGPPAGPPLGGVRDDINQIVGPVVFDNQNAVCSVLVSAP